MPNATNDRELLEMVKAGRYSEKWNAVEERTDDPFMLDLLHDPARRHRL